MDWLPALNVPRDGPWIIVSNGEDVRCVDPSLLETSADASIGHFDLPGKVTHWMALPKPPGPPPIHAEGSTSA